ncbi:MAG: hypothetical protein OEW23_14505 [Candidatus Aminicenantes bacterium]|nr:hypothetical protein [Candidatus Aminicenantes bacterium]
MNAFSKYLRVWQIYKKTPDIEESKWALTIHNTKTQDFIQGNKSNVRTLAIQNSKNDTLKNEVEFGDERLTNHLKTQ